MTDWTPKQSQQYRKIADISHKLAYQAAEKALRDAGLWPVSYGAFINIEERIGEAIRRGAIELIILQNSTDKEWENREIKTQW